MSEDKDLGHQTRPTPLSRFFVCELNDLFQFWAVAVHNYLYPHEKLSGTQ